MRLVPPSVTAPRRGSTSSDLPTRVECRACSCPRPGHLGYSAGLVGGAPCRLRGLDRRRLSFLPQFDGGLGVPSCLIACQLRTGRPGLDVRWPGREASASCLSRPPRALLEQAWVRVTREALGGEGRVVPQTVALLHHCPRGVPRRPAAVGPRRLRRLAPWQGLLLRSRTSCPLFRADGSPHPGADRNDGHVLHIARAVKTLVTPSLRNRGPNAWSPSRAR